MPPVSKKRSPAQLVQTNQLHVLRQPRGQFPSEAETAILQASHYKEAMKGAQRNLRNERKCLKRANSKLTKDKENIQKAAEDHGNEVEKLGRSLAKVGARLEEQKKRNKALTIKVSCFPRQKRLAVRKAVRLSEQNAKMKIKTRSGRISTPARRVIRELVIHHKVSTSMVGGVLSVLTNAGPGEEVSPRSSRRIVGEVGVGNKLRIASKVRKSKGKQNLQILVKRLS